MRISRGTAMRIVSELSSVIPQDINFVDDTAHIIAGTNPARIGSFHGAAERLLRENLPELIVYHDGEYEGARKGVNLPISFEQHTVAVIGLTGDYAEVERYGRIIKKMTEILLLDDFLKEQKRQAQDGRNRFVQEWIFGEGRQEDGEFAGLGLTVGIDILRPRRVLVASAAGGPEGDYLATQAAIDAIFRAIERVLREDAQNVLLVNGSKFLCMVTERPDAQICALARAVREEVLSRCGVSLRFGADSSPVVAGQAREGFSRADKALWSSRLSAGREELTFYSDISLELFVNDLPEKSRREFVRRVFKNCTDVEIAQWVGILSTLFACNGSIGQTAQRLFLHKNTLQYRLNKLRERTGYDPRALGESSLYYIAIVFFDMDSGTAN